MCLPFFLDENITAVQPTALSAIFFLHNFLFLEKIWKKFVNFGPKIPVGRLLRRTRICSEMFASALIGYRWPQIIPSNKKFK